MFIYINVMCVCNLYLIHIVLNMDSEANGNGGEKYWVHLAIGAILGWLVSLWALCGLCCIEKARQKKYYGIGVAVGILVGIITWVILYFAVFAAIANAATQIGAAINATQPWPSFSPVPTVSALK